MDVLNENKSSKATVNTPGEDIVALQREITAENALIKDIFTSNRTGFVTISYRVAERNQTARMREVTLIISNQTRIRDQFGNRIGFRDLRTGMVVNARFSSDMTRSIPPQARAFSISVVKESMHSIIEQGMVLRVERQVSFGYILTGIPDLPGRQMRYVVSNTTKLRGRRGNPIPFRAIQPGQIVRIEREPFQTMSIPPQTSALTVQIISGIPF